MADEGKKISFGFSKLVKKTSIVPSKLTISNSKPDDNKIEFIDCLEGKSIKLKDPVKSENNVLIIPLKKQEDVKNVTDISNIASNLESQNTTNEFGVASHLQNEVCSKNEQNDFIINGVESELTLEEIAAKEIMDDLNKKNIVEETRVFSVPLTSNAPLGEKESTLDDYDNIPVNDFGVAMLRGMGWMPGKGIGKNEKLVTPTMPTLRPKGMGLGADKVIKTALDTKSTNEDLKMTKGSFVRVIAGSHKDCYGQIEGFDDESGRMIVKLALKSMSVSLNEFMVQLVDKVEYTKNSKVINVSKYEQYKDNEDKKDTVSIKSKEGNLPLSNRKHKDSGNNGKKSDIGLVRSMSTINEPKRKQSSSSESDYVKTKQDSKRKISPLRKSRERSYQKRSPSSSSNSSISSCSDEYKRHKSRSSSMSKTKSFSSRGKTTIKSSSHKEHRSTNKQIVSTSSDSSSEYSSKNKYRTKKKKPSSRRPKSRSRSRSPRKHSSHKKHKKSKYR